MTFQEAQRLAKTMSGSRIIRQGNSFIVINTDGTEMVDSLQESGDTSEDFEDNELDEILSGKDSVPDFSAKANELRVGSLTAENKRLRNELLETRAQLAENEERIAYSVKKESRRLQRIITSKEEEISRLTSSLEKMEKRIDDILNDKEKDGFLKPYRNYINKLEKELSEWKAAAMAKRNGEF